ncbi:hypothetical protein BDV93DRAFT_520539 [Ceratobasidium sp. AG-I]|nr:hypothetical protein BDV93DRAFT_520539 [Ceratobasidium sp. AG-I]
MHSPKFYKGCFELEGIIVSVGNAGGDHDEYLPAYPYNEPDKMEGAAEYWIAAELGQHFCVHWGYEGDLATRVDQGLRCYVEIEGAKAGSGYLPPDSVQAGRDIEITGFQKPGGLERPYVFGCREAADMAAPSTKVKSPETLGEIKVVVHWARIAESGEECTTDDEEPAANEQLFTMPVLEKYIEAQHKFAVGLGDPEPSEAIRLQYRTKGVDNWRYWFVFHFAPKDWLATKFNIKQVGKLPANRPIPRKPRAKTKTKPKPKTKAKPKTKNLAQPLRASRKPIRGGRSAADIVIDIPTPSPPPAHHSPSPHRPLMARTRMLKRRAEEPIARRAYTHTRTGETKNSSSTRGKKPHTNKV